MVARFDIFIHHPYTTTTKIAKMIFCCCCTAATSPTKLILAKTACHMITASIFLDTSTAHRTEWDISFIFLCPASKLLVHCIFTLYIFSMPLTSTVEADFGIALGALKHFDRLICWSSDRMSTRRLWTISYQRISVLFLLLLESLILIVEILSIFLR